ncbi:MAG: holo-ACP synthase [Candidatus Omnitrophica bacterium]|nr:holo-ACP synthase [Candidatus Omnitrophota bacterium]
MPTDTMKGIKKFGIGTDIESIDRFRRLDPANNSIFLNKVFTKNELNYCFSKEKAASYLAVRYAGKEAIVKALGGMDKPSLNYKDIEILNKENEIPVTRINNKDFRDLRVYVTLSHCNDKAIAFAIVMGNN